MPAWLIATDAAPQRGPEQDPREHLGDHLRLMDPPGQRPEQPGDGDDDHELADQQRQRAVQEGRQAKILSQSGAGEQPRRLR
jgi:hypothetical protein